MSDQENPLERDGTVVMPRFQSAMANLKTKLRDLQQEAEAQRLTELRSLIHEEVDRALHPGTIDPRQYRHVDITDSDGTRWRGMVYLVEPEEGDKG